MELLEGVSSAHSNVVAANFNDNDKVKSFLRTPSAAKSHPLIRIHPVTQNKTIYLSNKFTKNLEGLDREESEMFLRLSRQKVAKLSQICILELRARWVPGKLALRIAEDISIRRC
jgi:alpha-ketoglutarate-dependent taurine dioxygenase